MSGGIWGNVPLTEESGRYPTEPEQALAAGMVGGLWGLLDEPRKAMTGESPVWDPGSGHVSDRSIGWAADRALGRAMSPQRVAIAPGEAVFGVGAFHGSPTANLTELRPSERGPLGPGVYLSPAEMVARRYAGPEGHLYEVNIPDTDLFHGIKSRDSSVNPYQVWRDQSARLVDAADPSQRQSIAALVGRMDPSDGYPFFARLSQLLGGQDKAQALIQQAGYKGMTGTVDGPEIVHFGALPLSGTNQ